MKYISTRGGSQNTQEPQTFTQVLLSGLAPDGGLYVPTEFPTLDLDALRGKSYQDIAEAVMFPFVEGDITRADLRLRSNRYFYPSPKRPRIRRSAQTNDNHRCAECF